MDSDDENSVIVPVDTKESANGQLIENGSDCSSANTNNNNNTSIAVELFIHFVLFLIWPHKNYKK